VPYLGHVISGKGVSPDPKNKAEAKSFIGVCSYYRRFIKGFPDTAAPIFDFARKNSRLPWGETQQAAFDVLRRTLVEASIGETGASKVGIGTTLTQRVDGKDVVVQRISRSLEKHEKSWAIRELEAMAVCWACQVFRPYMLGRRFEPCTDHERLKWTMEQRGSGRLARWALCLGGYEFDIRCRKGSLNGPADCLSRLPIDDEFGASVEVPATHGGQEPETKFLSAMLQEAEERLARRPPLLLRQESCQGCGH
jgi:hypothetical protein